MRPNKLYQLLSSIPSADMEELNDYLLSPYSKTKTSSRLLWSALRPFYPKFELLEADKKAVFAFVFPAQPFQYEKISGVAKRLRKAIGDFCALQALKKDREGMNWYRLSYFANAQGVFSDALIHRDMGLSVSQRRQLDGLGHFHQWRICSELFFDSKRAKAAERLKDLDLMVWHFDRFWLIEKLKQSCELLSRGKFLNKQELPVLLPEILTFIEQRQIHESHLLIRLYYRLTQLHLQGSDAIFYLLKTEVLNRIKELSFNDATFILHNLINYANLIYNRGQKEYIHHVFDIYKRGIETGMIPGNQQMTMDTFLNFLMTCALTRQFTVARSFVQQQLGKIAPKDRTFVKGFGLAILFFHEGHHQKAVNALSAVQKVPPLRSFQAWSLRIRACYCLFIQGKKGYGYKYFYHLSRGFESFINSKRQISKTRKSAYLNQIRYLRKLARFHLAEKSSRKTLERWEAEATTEPHLISRGWVIGQIRDMIGRL